jgi:predicted ATPase
MHYQFIRSVELLADTIENRDIYPFNLAAVRHLERLEFHPNVTFLVGENGSGKSTFMEAIAVRYGLNAEGGSKNFTFSTHATHSDLHNHMRIAKGISRPKDAYFLRAESYYNVATNIDELDAEPGGPPIRAYYGGTSLHEQSHGESFFALFKNRFMGNGIYLLDEPEAALSPRRQMELLTRLHELVHLKSQFIIATHSPILLSYPNSVIYYLSDAGYQTVKYKDTEHYQLYKKFLDQPEHMLEKLSIDIISQ